MDDIYNQIELMDCPICQGPGVLEEENGWCFYVSCLDCGCHTAEIGYSSPSERLMAAQKAAWLWHMGKVLSSEPGE